MKADNDINKQVPVLSPAILREQADKAENRGWDGVEIRFSIANLRSLADMLDRVTDI